MKIYNEAAKNKRTRGTITPEAKKLFLKEYLVDAKKLSDIALTYNVPVGTIGSIVKPTKKLVSKKQALTVKKEKVIEQTAITKLIIKREKLLTEVAAINQAIEILKDLNNE